METSLTHLPRRVSAILLWKLFCIRHVMDSSLTQVMNLMAMDVTISNMTCNLNFTLLGLKTLTFKRLIQHLTLITPNDGLLTYGKKQRKQRYQCFDTRQSIQIYVSATGIAYLALLLQFWLFLISVCCDSPSFMNVQYYIAGIFFGMWWNEGTCPVWEYRCICISWEL